MTVQKNNQKMKAGVMKMLIRETLLEMLTNDVEVMNLLEGFVKSQASALVESAKSTPSIENSKPKNTELWDSLLEVASGEKESISYNGKRVKAPMHGAGFQSGNKIKMWTSTAYTKLGGEWIEKTNNNSTSSRNNIELSPFMKEEINSITKDGIRNIDERGNVIGSVPPDVMSDILADTARTTLKEQNSAGHYKNEGSVPMPSKSFDVFNAIVKESNNLEDIFSDRANANSNSSWASLAFQ